CSSDLLDLGAVALRQFPVDVSRQLRFDVVALAAHADFIPTSVSPLPSSLPGTPSIHAAAPAAPGTAGSSPSPAEAPALPKSGHTPFRPRRASPGSPGARRRPVAAPPS